MSEVDSESKKREVLDERGNRYVLKRSLGEGGQGIVCETDYENTLVKICRRPKADRAQWMAHIRWLMLQDLTGLYIARPVARIVKPQPGYVMELMDGLESIQILIEATEVALQDGNVEKYLKQGGVRRRLKLLARLARTLADLHGRGMAFGDLSPANIFISKDPNYAELWLIDCDNICVNQRSSFDINDDVVGKAGRLFTPFYGAPEIVRGDAMISSLTDVWSFAVIAYRLLRAIHPFIGDMVGDGEPELEAAALAGKLPWVDHPVDHSNKSSHGLPRDSVLLNPLKDIFELCFNAGRDTPEQRPSMAEWAEQLEHCCERLVDCPVCNASYFYQRVDGRLACDFCDEPPKPDSIIPLQHYLFDRSVLDLEGAKSSDCYIDTGSRQVVNNGAKVTIKSSPPGSGFYTNAKSLYDISLSEDGFAINPAPGIGLNIKVGSAKSQVFKQPFQLKIGDKLSRNIYVSLECDSSVRDICIFKW
jgi:serine/threonine protein kinase